MVAVKVTDANIVYSGMSDTEFKELQLRTFTAIYEDFGASNSQYLRTRIAFSCRSSTSGADDVDFRIQIILLRYYNFFRPIPQKDLRIFAGIL